MRCAKCGNNFENVNFCPYCGYRMNGVSPNMNNRNKKYSILGVLALIFTVTFFLGFIGIILAIIDLIINGKKYKKELSVISICIFSVYSILLFSSITKEAELGRKEVTTTATDNSEDKISLDTQSEIEEFEKLCSDFNYEDYARDPEKYIGYKVKINVKIFDKSKGGFFDSYKYTYKAFTDDGSGYFMNDMIWLFDNRDSERNNYMNILEGDVVTIYGTFYGTVETQNMLNKSKGESIGFEIIHVELIEDSE